LQGIATNNSNESWLTHNRCTYHITYDEELFKELNKTTVSKVIIGNRECIALKGKSFVAMQ